MGGSFARALPAVALRARRLPRPACPVTGRERFPPYLPGAAPSSSRARPYPRARVCRSPGENVTVTGPERRALSGLAPPAQPSGPDSEGQAIGQARQARGEPTGRGQCPRAIHSCRWGRSAPMVVSGPWPVWITVAGSSTNSRSRIESMMVPKSEKDRPGGARPPANKVSPLNSQPRSTRWKHTAPRECPGVCRTASRVVQGVDHHALGVIAEYPDVVADVPGAARPGRKCRK